MTKQNKEDSIRRLKEIIKEDSTVYTVLLHVSRSGLQRKIAVFAIHEGEIVNISFYVSNAIEYGKADGSVKINGCGMDMGFEIVYNIGAVLFGNGYKIKHRWL